eukprot:6347508-Prymnesium_polylepis.1
MGINLLVEPAMETCRAIMAGTILFGIALWMQKRVARRRLKAMRRKMTQTMVLNSALTQKCGSSRPNRSRPR